MAGDDGTDSDGSNAEWRHDDGESDGGDGDDGGGGDVAGGIVGDTDWRERAARARIEQRRRVARERKRSGGDT